MPFGILCGVAFGLVNGFGVAYLRIPSMIVTLATNAVAQGLMVVYTGGFSPQDSASPVMRWLATGFAIPGCRTRCWSGWRSARRRCSCSTRTTFGRAVYGIGNSERAAYLSGVTTRRVVLIAFAIAGAAWRLRRRAAGRLCLEGGAVDGRRLSLAVDRRGGAGRDHVLGGRGSYLGTVAGVILITLLQSILSVMQMRRRAGSSSTAR